MPPFTHPLGDLVLAEVRSLRPDLAAGPARTESADSQVPGPSLAATMLAVAEVLVWLGPSQIRAGRCVRCVWLADWAKPRYLPHHAGLVARMALRALDEPGPTLVLDLFDNTLRPDTGCSHGSG